MKYTPTYSNIQLKRGTTDRWTVRNPILLAGEIGLEIIDNGSSPDTYKIKIGDGVNTWTQLPYYGDTQDITSLVADSVTSTGVTATGSLKATSTTGVTLSQSDPPLMIGNISSTNLAFDGNEIQARANGLASTLYLQSYGGATELGINNASNNSNLIVNGSLTMLSGSTVNATISSSGYLTLPKQPAFSAYASASSITPNKIMPYNSAVINRGGHYNASTYRFTAPVAGIYLFSIYDIGQTSGTSRFSLYKNGASTEDSLTHQLRGANGANFTSATSFWTISANAGDYFSVYIYETGSYGTIEYSWFQGFLIG